jgi:uncharacterized protein (TIGR00369 family)
MRSRRSSTSADRAGIRERFQASTDGRLPGLFGLEVIAVEPGRVEARMDVRSEFLAPNDFLHAGAIITLADTACGMGCIASVPDEVAGFTTVELKSNFLRSARAGDGLGCLATMAHGGRRTQVWDAVVTRESDGKDLALFRCTQYLLPASDERTARQAALRTQG